MINNSDKQCLDCTHLYEDNLSTCKDCYIQSATKEAFTRLHFNPIPKLSVAQKVKKLEKLDAWMIEIDEGTND